MHCPCFEVRLVDNLHHTSQCTVDCFQSALLSLASWIVLAEELQSKSLPLLRGLSQTPPRRRFLPIAAPSAHLLGNPGGGHTSKGLPSCEGRSSVCVHHSHSIITIAYLFLLYIISIY